MDETDQAIEFMLRKIPDPSLTWLAKMHPIRRSRYRSDDSLLGWVCPEATVFVLCVILSLGFGAVLLVSKTFFNDPDLATQFVNNGWFGVAYRAIDPTNGFQRIEDLYLPTRFPILFPLNQSWIYSKEYRQAEAAGEKWHLVRKKKWEEVDRPKLLKQIEEMEAQLALQQQQEAQARAEELQEMEPTSSVEHDD